MSAGVGVAMLGAGFIGRVHSLAYRNASMSIHRLARPLELVGVADRDQHAADAVAEQYEWTEATTDWRQLVDDDRVDIFDNAGPNDAHHEPCVAAAEAGKAVLCEKPLERDAERAWSLYRAVDATGVLNLCAFMYRSIPAIQHAKELIQAGELGDIHHVRARFLLSFANDAGLGMSWRFDRDVAGAGALGDLGSHHIDLARFLVGEVAEVSGLAKVFIGDRPGGRVTNDDSFVAIGSLATGATISIEGSRVAGNHDLTSVVELDGSKGSLRFDFERLNEISVSSRPTYGFRTYLVSRSEHPFSEFWFPAGIQGQHPLSWADCFAHQAYALVEAVTTGGQLAPWAPTFRDGYRVAETIETIARSAESGRREAVVFRDDAEAQR